MATLVLAATGKAIGGALFGSSGAILGQAAGALAGSVIDDGLFGEQTVQEGRRLADLSVQSSNEGSALPLVYGRVRLAGQVIWATSLEEEVREESQGGKGGGGSRVVQRSYHYYANIAVALCSGPISRLGAIWADGKPMDLSGVTWRVHLGRPDQAPDPLLSAIQGDTPAYRNTAYVVFERLPLDAFGDRIPQLTFEVYRSIEPLEPMIRAMTIIPGAGEFVYAPTPVTWAQRPGVAERLNHHVVHAQSNWAAALDDLQALCPNLQQVALVVSWFGDDLRCGSCQIRPKLENAGRNTTGMTWSVSGESAQHGAEVSRHNGNPAYGGTPADESVIRAIEDLRARGLKVAIHPFILMDIPSGNGLPDPYGGAEQAPHPWRGRMTTTLAPGIPGSSDGTSGAAHDIAAFVGTADPSSFTPSSIGVGFSGPSEWTFRRFILHYAHLAAAAGGVDAFFLGSEMRGLTRLRDGSGSYPFVSALKVLAADVKSILPNASIVYAADWTEYGAYQVDPDEVRFPLDPLWSDPAITAIGINAYFPLADMREDGDPDGNIDPYDLEALHSAVTSGEDYDWYYANEVDRLAGTRTPITDGAYSKPWMYRAKDLVGWWSQPHFDRQNGIEAAAPTDWVPESKPIWFTEFGVPAINRGANQPNIFFDEKSSESGWPRFSNGGRDDLIQRRAIEAVLGYWSGAHPQLAKGMNPVSSIYGTPMVDQNAIFLWCWDARPYPAFPNQLDVWTDGDNWRAGHWLSGRLGGCSLAGLIRALVGDFGIDSNAFEVSSLTGVLEGIAVAGPTALRRILAPLLKAHGVHAVDLGPKIAFRSAWSPVVVELDADDIVASSQNEPLVTGRLAQAADLPVEVRLAARDGARDFRRYVVASRRREGDSLRIEEIDLGATLDPGIAAGLADQLLITRWSEREELRFAVGPQHLALEPGDVVRVRGDSRFGQNRDRDVRIESLEDADARKIVAKSTRPPLTLRARRVGGEARPRTLTSAEAEPQVLIVDLPALPGESDSHSPRIAAFATPWPGAFDVYRAVEGGAFRFHTQVETPAIVGDVTAPISPGPTAVWDKTSEINVELAGGTLSSLAEEDVLAGGNAMVIIAPDGLLEVIQFAQADLVGVRRYRLRTLLRGGQGTEQAARRLTPVGARVILLDSAVTALPLDIDQLSVSYTYAIVPSGRGLSASARTDITHTATGRGLKPFAPVHLDGVRRFDGDVAFSWVRRTREGGDGWRETDVPLAEEDERYRVDILSHADAVLWSREVSSASAVLTQSEELALFGSQQSSMRLRVAQISAVVGDGLFAVADLDL